MYYIDYHTHSELSPDSSTPLLDQARAAVRAGLSELCITDHYDTVGPDGEPAGPCLWASRTAQYQRVKEEFRGKLVLRLGVEFGSAHLSGQAVTTAPAELDFVIGSLHNFSSAAGGGDYYYGDYHCPTACHAALDDYFAQMAALAPLPVYDVLGHVIYPLRYMEGVCPVPLSLDPYEDRIREILRAAVQAGHGIEVNTYRGKTLQEWLPILRQLRAVGGEVVTVGSDAHTPSGIGKGVPEAYELLRETGFRYITTFSGRRPAFVKL